MIIYNEIVLQLLKNIEAVEFTEFDKLSKNLRDIT